MSIDFQRIAGEVEKEWLYGGLSDGLYYDYAKEIAIRFIFEKGKQDIANSDLRYLDITSKVFIKLLSDLDDEKATELYNFYFNS